MKTKISLMAVAFGLLLTGCAFNGNHSGNVLSENSQKMLEGIPKGDAVETKTTEITDSTGLVRKTVETKVKTNPQNYLELAHDELRVADDVATQQAKTTSTSSGSGGFWGWLNTPAYPTYYNGGYYSTGGGGFGDNFSPHIGGNEVALGGAIISVPGGNNGNFSPHIGRGR